MRDCEIKNDTELRKIKFWMPWKRRRAAGGLPADRPVFDVTSFKLTSHVRLANSLSSNKSTFPHIFFTLVVTPLPQCLPSEVVAMLDGATTLPNKNGAFSFSLRLGGLANRSSISKQSAHAPRWRFFTPSLPLQYSATVKKGLTINGNTRGQRSARVG